MTDSQRVWLLVSAILMMGLVYLLAPILSPFIAGAAFAYLFDPVADKLEEKGLSRTLAVVAIFFVFALLVGVGVLVLIPLLGDQIQLLHVKLPHIIEWLNNKVLPWFEELTGVSILTFKENFREVIFSTWDYAGEYIQTAAGQVTRSGLAIFALIGNLVLIPVVTFYLLRDWDQLIAKVSMLLPRNIEKRVKATANECDEVLGAFIRGQLIVMFLLGCTYSLGLWLSGIDFALLVGLLAGLASIIPYLGFVVGITIALIIAFFQHGDLLHLALVLGVFSIGQMLEGMVFTPLLVGDRIGLHPVAVIFSILAGAQLFGFTGMLLALPVAAIIMVLINTVRLSYLESGLYGVEVNKIEAVQECNDLEPEQ
ncbi:MAG: AI-2E family transporter [Gammaproteobacteria bacterium]|nr:AI-2E family transporter [Gammaproteobacteria bacterium]